MAKCDILSESYAAAKLGSLTTHGPLKKAFDFLSRGPD